MQTIAKAKKGAIVIGGLITSLASSLGLDTQIATLDPLPDSTSLDLNPCLAQKLVKLISGNKYYLMIRNQIVRSIMLPNRARIDVCDAGYW
ncbi:DNA (cytosine-5)-methyltransferase DRM2-like [Trifolium medium]|uniref:DNA (Cytosine-5)-methyltransferase DRM2-like n=1 Tax=Trifolium medium TaxID=97028 RepID=A0A392RAL1_9FABA|nr:DNA (cytosine-5)-methyltransferase DRM2-like [Trifolium medium]